ncbi:ankyrin repeat-containing domain protein [Truncatella angustata]|uniref:Ankyrin repeat-containing domain protein n=1 Tax=Truncatella angustata TaxID=152316 RepID=A0A9P8UVQ6_9PEZI|nr:ankyrin repeat-containing domain protein [Truncatella angustata]KAH6659070.1 ankyrin repeat-containing domain protein [Truncatella angustata]
MTQQRKTMYAQSISTVQVEPELLHAPQQSILIEVTSEKTRHELTDIQIAGFCGICNPIGDTNIEAIHAHVAELVSTANQAFRHWQKRIRLASGACAELDHSLSKILKQLCVDAHSLGLRCYELDSGATLSAFTETPHSCAKPRRLQACIRALSQISQETPPSFGGRQPTVLSPETRDIVYTELVEHKVWVAAAGRATTLEDVANLMCTELTDSPERDVQDTPLVEQWASIPGSLLWITGSLRAELAIQAAYTIRYISRRASSASAICYVFCNQTRSPDEMTLELLRVIIGQLAQQNTRVYEILKASEHNPFQRTFEGLCSLMSAMLHCLDHVDFVIEGLGISDTNPPRAINRLFSMILDDIFSQTTRSRITTISMLILSYESPNVRGHSQYLEATINGSTNGLTASTLDPNVETEMQPPVRIRIIGLDRLAEVARLRWNQVTPTNTSQGIIMDSIRTLSRTLADNIHARSLKRFTAASHAIDRLLSHFLMDSRGPSNLSSLIGQSRGQDSRVDLLHPSLVEFLSIQAKEPLLPLGAYSTSVSSSSMAVFCLRYICHSQFSAESKRGFREEKRRVSYRDEVNPFYRYAAITWQKLSADHWDDCELQTAARQLFDTANSFNLRQWVVEYAQVWFPYDVGFQALSHKPLMELATALAGPQDLRLHVAASMGLSYMCEQLSNGGADLNATSVFGTPLYAALAGPAALVGPWVHIVQEHARLDRIGSTNPHQRATIRSLLDSGAQCNIESSTKDQTISTGIVALITCSKLRDANTFFRIIKEQAAIDSTFATYFQRSYFLESLNSTHSTNKEARSYLNELCEGLAQHTIASYEQSPASTVVYDQLWNYTLANKLDWFEKIDGQRVADILDMSDEEYDTFVTTKAIEGLNVMRLVSKDPRFNPNKIGKDGHPLLLKVLDQGLELVRLIVEKGADLSVRDNDGLTIAHLSAQQCKNDVLRYVVEQGAATGLVPVKEDGSVGINLAGCNVWHFAAKSSMETLETLVEIGIQNAEELFVTCGLGHTPLAGMLLGLQASHQASKSSTNTLDAVIQLLRKIHIRDHRLFDANTPIIHKAAQLGSQQLIETLLAMGAKVSLDSTGSSPLHVCLVEAGQPYLRYVRDICIDLPLQNAAGYTPIETLISARIKGTENIPSYVNDALLCTATKQSRDSKGQGLWERTCTQLIPCFVLVKGSMHSVIVPFVYHLIEHGVMHEYEATSKASGVMVLLEGLSEAETVPVWLAQIICRILQRTKHEKSLTGGQNVATCLKWATRINNFQLVHLMLRHGAHVHEEASKISALQAACLSPICNLAMFNLLLENADVTKLNDLGQQGLGLVHLLTQKDVKQRESKLRALLSKGANPNLCSKFGLPALVMYIMEDHSACIDVLLEFGADVNAKNQDGKDAALMAASRGNLPVLWKLYNDSRLKVDWHATCFATFNVRRPEGFIKLEFSGANALHLAALNCSLEVLEFYLKNSLVETLELATFPDYYRLLHFASLGGSSATIKSIVEWGADIKTRTRDGSSALNIAVQMNHAGAVKTLIDLGSPVESFDNFRNTPLIYALRIGSKEVIDTLLNSRPPHGKDTPLQDPASFSQKRIKYLSAALDTAIRRSDLRLCRLLLTAGCSFKTPLPSCHGCTPIMAALGQDRADIALWLLEVMEKETKRSALDGQCNKHYENGTTSLGIACSMQNCEKVLPTLLETYSEAGINWLQWPLGPLHLCAAKNKPKALRLILDYVVKNEVCLRTRFPDLPKQLDRWALNQMITASELGEPYDVGLTPLNVAIQKESTDTARLLLEAGANPNLQDLYRNAPLHLAVEVGCLDIVKELIKHGAQTERQNSAGYSPLMLAVEEGLLDIAKALIEAGADTSVCNANRMSLLNIAGDWSENPAIFQYLLGFGLDPYKTDSFDCFPLHDAISNPDLTTYVVNSDVDFYRACEHDVPRNLLSSALEHRGILPRLMRRIPPQFLPDRLINVRPAQYQSPLCHAARRGGIENVKILIQYGADLEFEGCDEGTAVMAASRAGHLEVVQYLVRAGATVCYFKNGIIRSALTEGKRFDAVVQWLLVGRWMDQPQIPLHADESTTDSNTRLWTGVVMAEMELTGVSNQYGHAWDETMLGYLQRLNELRLDLRGKVVHSVRWH